MPTKVFDMGRRSRSAPCLAFEMAERREKRAADSMAELSRMLVRNLKPVESLTNEEEAAILYSAGVSFEISGLDESGKVAVKFAPAAIAIENGQYVVYTRQ